MNLLQIARMVLWSLLGIRSSAGSEADIKAFRPAHVVGVVIVMVAAFLGLLLAIAYTAIGSLS